MNNIVEVICVGNELLSGITLNSNAHWLAGQISAAGWVIRRVTTVRDQVDEISAAVREVISRRPGLIMITGGLGATYDDMTLEGVALALGKQVRLDRRAVAMLKKSYASRGLDYELTEARLKMATIPDGSTPLQNLLGSAPAVRLRSGRTDIFCLQGVPPEMQEAFRKYVLPMLRKAVGRFVLQEARFEVTGITEAMLAPGLSKIVRSAPMKLVYIKTHPRGYRGKTPRLMVHIISKGTARSDVKARLKRASAGIQGEIKKLGGTSTKIEA